MSADTLTLTLHNSEDITLIFQALQQLEQRSRHNFSMMRKALHELIENTLEHAYDEHHSNAIHISVTFTLKACQLQVILQEFGKPFDFSPYLSEPIDHQSDHSKGFYRIYDLVDYFYFTPMGKEGKRFTLISHLANCLSEEQDEEHPASPQLKIDTTAITTTPFEPHHAQAISQLIYHNYDYTYYKPYFYNPAGIKIANSRQEVHSVVAIYDEEVIGHFALVTRVETSSAEVAIAVVHPKYKGLGVMKLMFDSLIDEAKRSHYRSIFGEAIMLHPYSQKANLNKGMFESAIVLGLVPDDIEIEHDLKIPHRSGVLVGYLIFEKRRASIHIPQRYRALIMKSEAQFSLTRTKSTLAPLQVSTAIHKDEELNLVAFEINTILKQEELSKTIAALLLEQTDMIYVDINLHRIETIDQLIRQLNELGFFYSGILYDYYHDEDYLRLQKICSKNIDTDHLVTYSQFSKALLELIKKDITLP